MGCSGGGGGSPVMPGLTGTDLEMTPAEGGHEAGGLANKSNHFLWGMWNLRVNADHTAIEVIPIRVAAFHVNVVGYLENPPGNQLIKIVNVSMSQDDTLLVDVQLIHPFPGSMNLTGRDVRGIAIFDADAKGQQFPATFVTDVDKQPASIYASRMLLNADGFTTFWNRWMFSVVEHPQMNGYIVGNLSTPGEPFIKGNLHGFKAYWTDPIYRIFQSNQAATRTFEIDPPKGPFEFAYAVDASWDVPLKIPVGDPWNDFGTSANCPEPYQISATVIANSLTKTGGTATVQFDVFDWQDATNFSAVHVEAPALFSGKIDPGAPIGFPTLNSARYEVDVLNTLGIAVTAGGGSDLMVVVEDSENSIVNPDLTAYNIFKLPVADVPGFWRDRHGNGSFVNVPLAAPLIEPSSISVGEPDLAIVSYPEEPYTFFGGDPELILFDDDDERFIVWNRTLDSTWEKAGYPGSIAPSWLDYPHSMDVTPSGWLSVGSHSTIPIPDTLYTVKNVANMINMAGIYGYSWYTGTAPTTFETIRDITGGFGNLHGDPVYAFFAYESGVLPPDCKILSIGSPYIDWTQPNTFRSSVPRSDAGGIPDAIYQDSQKLRCAADTEAYGQLYQAFYVLESNPSMMNSEVEGFKINFSNIPTTPVWRISNADINAEFPGAWAVDVETVPSSFKSITTVGDTVADFNWLCVLMEDASHYWLAFYDPLNPLPDNPGNNPQRSIYTSNKILKPGIGFETVAMDVDYQYFEVYALARDTAPQYYMSVFEFYY